MKKIKYPYSRPNVNNKDVNAIIKVLRSQYLAQGKVVKKFEKYIECKLSVNEAIVCNSGTAALHALYRSIGLNKNNGIITTPITFLATASAARMCNAPVHFADVDPISGLITPKTLEKALKEAKFHVKLAVIVHLGGHLCDLEGLSKVSKRYGCLLVEDACHALGAKYISKKKDFSPVGSCKYSIASTFSFHAIKNITMGEGGCVTTNNKELAKIIRLNINHGMIKEKNQMINPPKNSPWYYQMQDIGWNYRASEISCALGLSQFKRIDKIILKRCQIAEYYKKYLNYNNYLKLPKFYENNFSAGWHLFQLQINFNALKKNKSDFINHLKKSSVGAQVHYIPLILQPYYKKLFKKEDFEGAINFYNKTISVPMYTELKKNSVQYIAKVINEFFD